MSFRYTNVRHINVEVRIIQRGLISPSVHLPENGIIVCLCIVVLSVVIWTSFQYPLSLNVNPMYAHIIMVCSGTWLRCSDKHVNLPLSLTHYGVWRCRGRCTQGARMTCMSLCMA